LPGATTTGTVESDAHDHPWPAVAGAAGIRRTRVMTQTMVANLMSFFKQ
jgi:hypothetical protein